MGTPLFFVKPDVFMLGKKGGNNPKTKKSQGLAQTNRINQQKGFKIIFLPFNSLILEKKVCKVQHHI